MEIDLDGYDVERRDPVVSESKTFPSKARGEIARPWSKPGNEGGVGNGGIPRTKTHESCFFPTSWIHEMHHQAHSTPRRMDRRVTSQKAMHHTSQAPQTQTMEVENERRAKAKQNNYTYKIHATDRLGNKHP